MLGVKTQTHTQTHRQTHLTHAHTHDTHTHRHTPVPSQDDHPWNPQTRTTTETVLREAMQALVRVQAHMRKLARIVVEIRSAGLAVELGL